jgi:UDP-N-acetyl-D-mannosaminuronic acid dehydrogenase
VLNLINCEKTLLDQTLYFTNQKKRRIMEKICILGLGYIGLPTAAMFATHGKQVIGVDINDNIIKTLNNGGIHIQEPGLEALVKKAILSGKLCVDCKPEPSDAFIIAVPTPINEDKTADMRAVISAAEAIVPHLKPGNLVMLESTSPPLTTVNLVKPILEKSGLKAGEDFFLAYSPERVLPGKILDELKNNARVVGGINKVSSEVGKELYSCFVLGEIVLTDTTTAEMVKLMENTYRDINIAIANEFSRLADRLGIDVWEAIKLANRHPRVDILKPGPGVGGHCISVDPWFLVEAAPDISTLIQSARTVNDNQPRYVVDEIKHILGSLAGRRIALLGLSYKPEVDDLRESPAITVATLLVEEGAVVTAHEPYSTNNKFGFFYLADTVDEAIEQAEIIVLLVAHNELCSINPYTLSKTLKGVYALDTVNGWDIDLWERAGFLVVKLGSKSLVEFKNEFNLSPIQTVLAPIVRMI